MACHRRNSEQSAAPDVYSPPRPFPQSDVPVVAPADSADYLSRVFHHHWREEVQRSPTSPSLSRALRKTVGRLFYSAALFKLMNDILTFVGPYLMSVIIAYTQATATAAAAAPSSGSDSGTGDSDADTQGSLSVGMTYVAAILISSLSQTMVLHAYFFRVFRVGMNLRSTVVVAVYRKALLLSVTARQRSTVGEIVNIMSSGMGGLR